MERVINSGDKFGLLEVIEFSGYHVFPNGRRKPKYLCKCECGSIVSVNKFSLVYGYSKSCGCRRSKRDEYVIKEEYAELITDSGDKALIDISDIEELKQVYWYKQKDGYFRGKSNGKYILLHRFIMNCPENMVVDHINHDKSDNRKCNLRIVTSHQNSMNSSARKTNISKRVGVHWNKRDCLWYATIGYKYRHIHLGAYKKYEDAVHAREEAEKKYFGKYAYSNLQDAMEIERNKP